MARALNSEHGKRVEGIARALVQTIAYPVRFKAGVPGGTGSSARPGLPAYRKPH